MSGDLNQKYYYALGRRKESVATVRLFEGEGADTVNGKEIKVVFPLANDLKIIYRPFEILDEKKKYHFTVVTKGGGIKGQRNAIMLGLSRALVKVNPEFKGALKKEKLLTRDPREVERKKTGLRKARKAPQFSKR